MKKSCTPRLAFAAGATSALLIVATASWFSPTKLNAAPPKYYGVYAISDDGQQLAPGIPGTIILNATGLQMSLDDIAQRGLRLHSVVSNGAQGGYVVIAEQ